LIDNKVELKRRGEVFMKQRCALLGIAILLCVVPATAPYATAAIVPSLLLKLSTLTGREVQDPKGAKIGEIEDVVIDAASGQIAYAVLSFGGFLGLGESWVAMPWRSLQTMDRGQTFTLNMSEEQLKNAPKFDPKQWPDMEDLHWGDTIHAYYGQKPYWHQQMPPTAAHENAEPPQFQLLRSEQALRHEVINTRGQRIGHIEDIVIDTALGDIAYAVLSFGGFLGVGEKWFAVPWSAFESSAGFRTLTLDVSKEALEKAPGFDKDDWPEMANRRWATTVHNAFGQPPYWERHKGGSKAPEGGDKTPQAPTK
jgi:sporulation protein YlmC with PRC-barrel domain